MTMKLSFTALKKISLRGTRISSMRAHARSTIILGSIGALALLLIGFLAFDVYLFYLARSAPPEPTAPNPTKTLRPEDIDQAIRVLDQRAAAFQQIASSTAPR